MTARELLNDLSGALLSDERVLSVREKELLASLLQRAQGHSSGNDILSDTIAQTVGEVVAQRAWALLGSSITQQLAGQPSNYTPHASLHSILWGKSPEPPSPKLSPEPPSPGPHMSPEPPSPKLSPEPPSPGPRSSPEPPSPKLSPEPPSPGPHMSPEPPSPKLKSPAMSTRSQSTEGHSVAVLDASEIEVPEVAYAHCVVLDEFLAPAELNELMQYTLSHQEQFKTSEVVSPGVAGGAVDFEYRRSHVLMDLDKHEGVIVERIRRCLPRILRRLELEPFAISRVEAQITCSGNGDFFRWHTDDGHDEIASRQLTFVYFFHREPKAFQGGELRVYDSEWRNGGYKPMENYRTIVPRQNQAVFFASFLAHEITPVECPSGAFADGRFTVNGWFHR